MASTSVVVSVLGSVKDLQNSLGEATKTTQSFADKVGGYGVAAGAAFTSVGGVLEHFGGQIEDAHVQLETAVKNSGNNFEDYSKEINQTIGHMEDFGHSSADTQAAMATLTTKLQDPQKAIADMAVAAEVAAAKHISLAAAAELVGKASDGNAKALKQFGLANVSGQEAVDALGKRLNGLAEGESKTFEGRMDAVKTKVEDFAGAIGQKVGPALVTIGPALAGLGPALSIGAKGFDALGAAMDFLAANPIILVVAALVAVGVGLYEAYQHVKVFHDAVNDVFGWVGGFVKTAMSTVVDAIHTVIGWVESNWPILLGILVGPIGLAVGEIIQHWNTIKGGFNDLVGFISGMPARIVSAARGMFDGIRDAFRAAINWIIGAWDSLHFKLGGWKIDGPFGTSITLPTVDMGLPHINPLAAGGIVTKPTLALVGEAGPEAVVPLSRSGMAASGPTIVNNFYGPQDPAGVARQLEELLYRFKQQGGNLRFQT